MELSAGAAEKGFRTATNRAASFVKRVFGLVPVVAVCLTLLFLASSAKAQTLSGINGTVTDTSGGVVPGAKVTVTNEATNVSQSTVTTSAGTYYVTDLIPGLYTVKVEKQGFSTFISTNVNVVAGNVSSANAKLQPGEVTQKVTVTAPSVSLQTEQPQVGTNVTETLTQNLPTMISGSNRQIDSFIFLAPGVTGGGFSHRVNGGVDDQTEVTFNGVPESFSEVSGYTFWNQPPYDSIKDVDVLTGTFSAKYGLSQGVEQYQTKSGTNQIHGDAFLFYRDSFFDAAGAYYDINPNNSGVIGAPNRDHEIDYGFSAGGPVFIPKIYNGKNRTFWYFSLDKYRQAFGQSPVNVPSQAEVQGNFSGLINPATKQLIPIYVPISWASNPALMPSGCTPGAQPGQQFPGNVIPGDCISSVSQSLLKYVPQPNVSTRTDNVSNYNPTFVPVENQSDYSINIDHTINSKQQIHGLFWRQYFPTQGGWIQNPLNNATWNNLLGRALNITYSYALTPSLVMTAGFMYVYQANDFYQQNPVTSFAGAQPSPTGGVYLPGINFGGGAWEPQNWGTGGWQFSINHKTGYSVENNWLWQHGRNTINMGVDIRKSSQNDDECQTCAGTLSFSSDITADPNEIADFPGSNGIGTLTGNGFASFLLGDATSAGRSFAAMTELRNTYVAPYFQDDMQVTRRLKVNWGVRWDLAFPFVNNNSSNQLSFFNASAPNPGEISTITGQPLLGAESILGTGCNGCVGWNTMNMKWDHLSPRLGFTYELNSKTVVLGGFSMFYLDTGAFEYGVNKVAVNYGNNLNGVFSASQPRVQVPGYGQWDSRPLPSPAKVPFSASIFNGLNCCVHQMYQNVNQAYDEQFVLGIQRQLPWQMFLSVSGVHTHDVHLPASLLSAINSLNYNFVKSVCPAGETSATQCVLDSPWTSSGAQALLQQQGFGQVTYATGLCGNSTGPVTYYAPYNNFCGDWGTGQPVYQAFAPYPTYGYIQNNFDTSGADKYNALQISLQKRTGSGLTFLVSYTLSRYLTNTDSGFSTFNFRGLNPQNPQAEWSVGNNDQTNVLTMAGVYELPFGHGRKFLSKSGRLLNNLVGGWELSMVNSYESGTPVQLAACGDQPGCDPLVFSTAGFNRPNVAGPNFGVNWNNTYKSVGGAGVPVINTADFSYPGAWRFGNGAPLYNDLRYAFQSNEKLSLAKTFYFTERIRGRLSMQYFNVLNRMQIGGCLDNNVTDPNFGLNNPGGDPTIPCQGNSPRQGQAEFQIFF